MAYRRVVVTCAYQQWPGQVIFSTSWVWMLVRPLSGGTTRREGAVEPQVATVAGHTVIHEVEGLLQRGDLLRQQVDGHAGFRVDPGENSLEFSRSIIALPSVRI